MADLDALERWDVSVFHNADLHPRHLAGIAPVSRPTVSRWLNHQQVPSSLIIAEVLRLQAAVQSALDAGLLPIPRGTKSQSEITERVKTTIQREIDKQT